MWAQALLEKGMLDGLSMQLTRLATNVSWELQHRPWLWILIGGVVFLLLIRRGR